MDLKVLSPNEAATYGRDYVKQLLSYYGDNLDHSQFKTGVVCTSTNLDGLPAKRAFMHAAIAEYLTRGEKQKAREAELKRRYEESTQLYEELFGDINGG